MRALLWRCCIITPARAEAAAAAESVPAELRASLARLAAVKGVLRRGETGAGSCQRRARPARWDGLTRPGARRAAISAAHTQSAVSWRLLCQSECKQLKQENKRELVVKRTLVSRRG